MTARKLFANQEKSVRFGLKHDQWLDFSDPGTGKTLTQLELHSRRKQAGLSKPALVVAPKSLLEVAWLDDNYKFTPHLTMSLAWAENRRQAFERPADLYVVNTDGVGWIADQPESFYQRFGSLVIDEMTFFKHHESQRSKALKKIAHKIPLRSALSGTPYSNSVLDIWHPVYCIDNGKRLGISYSAFRNATCTPVQTGPAKHMIKWEFRSGANDAIGHLLRDITIRFRLEDCHDMPQTILRSVEYRLPEKVRDAYDSMEERALAMFEDGTMALGINGAAVYTKLQQIASGAVYNDQGGYTSLDPGRYELILDLVEEAPHALVFFLWDHQRDGLVAEAKRRGISFATIDGGASRTARKAAVDGLQAGMHKVLFLHPASAAHGLTLTRATRTIWASPTYNLEWWEQGFRRMYRTGQTQRTETIVVVAKATVEAQIFNAVKTKNARLQDLLRMLKDGLDAKSKST